MKSLFVNILESVTHSPGKDVNGINARFLSVNFNIQQLYLQFLLHEKALHLILRKIQDFERFIIKPIFKILP